MTNKTRYPITDLPTGFIENEVERMNSVLQTLDCIKHFHLDYGKLTDDSYYFKEPHSLHAYAGEEYCFAVYYDANGNATHGSISIQSSDMSYNIIYEFENGTPSILHVFSLDEDYDASIIYKRY